MVGPLPTEQEYGTTSCSSRRQSCLGTGFFQNGGDTLRVGLDAELSGSADRFGWYASYGLVEATFESSSGAAEPYGRERCRE